jgi:Fe-S cluster assembly protein SufD
MTQQATQITEDTVRELSRSLGEPAWLAERRVAAWRQFEAMAMPSGIEEEWRRTDLSQFDLEGDLARFSLSQAPAPPPPPDAPGWRPYPPGVVIADLSQAARSHEALVREYLDSVVRPGEWKLQALAAALWSKSTFVYVPAGLETRLSLQHLGEAGVPLFARVLVIAEEGSSLTVIDESRSPDGGPQALIAGAVEVIQRPNSLVRWFDIQRWGNEAYNFTTMRARLGHGAQFLACNVGIGGRLTKGRIEAVLEGEGSQAELIGVSLGNGRQHFDYITLQDHLAPKTTSDLLYKAALTERSSEVWYGTVRIHGGATGSDANQTSRNLLLSETAKAAPIPVLEIEQYDILRCSHGATAGPVDEEQLFYLESRGIPHDEAERLLVDAFFQEVLDRIPDEAVRGDVRAALAAKLEGST